MIKLEMGPVQLKKDRKFRNAPEYIDELGLGRIGKSTIEK
jgi:hypothetical protein